ncbi:hypothetical protein VAE122_3220004 [Vibrio aestuarianus]|nr:hypothetical protein VAE122_3220004 [Vibrio aestuarianus]
MMIYLSMEAILQKKKPSTSATTNETLEQAGSKFKVTLRAVPVEITINHWI